MCVTQKPYIPPPKRCRYRKDLPSQGLCRFECWRVMPQLRGP
jgi:hypothetical protein